GRLDIGARGQDGDSLCPKERQRFVIIGQDALRVEATEDADVVVENLCHCSLLILPLGRYGRPGMFHGASLLLIKTMENRRTLTQVCPSHVFPMCLAKPNAGGEPPRPRQHPPATTLPLARSAPLPCSAQCIS